MGASFPMPPDTLARLKMLAQRQQQDEAEKQKAAEVSASRPTASADKPSRNGASKRPASAEDDE